MLPAVELISNTEMANSNRAEIEIQPINGEVDFEIRPPGSKSITNRALVCAALADGESVLSGVLDSDDTRVMIECLKSLGVQVESAGQDQLRVVGSSGRFHRDADLFVDNSGTTIRFLTAMLGMHGGNYRLHGSERMHERPIGPLVESLRALGAGVVAESEGGCPPVVVSGEPVAGGETTISGSVSSQYLSGLMMASPLASERFQLTVKGELVSQPYVSMTLEVMKSFGVEAELELKQTPIRFVADPSVSYRGCEYEIEPDASAASYFWAMAAICGGKATVTGLSRQSLQGDVAFVDCLESMGCKVVCQEDSITVIGPARKGIDVQMDDISDTVQTLAAVALCVEGETRIRGVAHNRVKETDRIGNLAIELRKLGGQVEEHEDGMTIVPGELQSATIETYNDHRMAMSLALVGLRQRGVVILDPGCTAKTYPSFFADLDRASR